jgi:hypothetical protein
MSAMQRTSMVLILGLACVVGACAPRPMLVGPARPLTTAGVRYTAGASWRKPLDHSAVGAPQLDGSLNLHVADGFDLAVRAWTTGGGLQGRLAALSRERGQGVDLLVAPLVGVGGVAGLKEEEKFLPPIQAEFLAGIPVALGIGVGNCSAYVVADPTGHLRPDRSVLRGAAGLGVGCPMANGNWISPEITVGGPLLGGADLRPEDGRVEGEPIHPLVSTTLQAGISFGF